MNDNPYLPPQPSDPLPPELPIDAQVSEIPRQPWGFWTTMGLSLIIAIVFVAVTTAATVVAAIVMMAAGRQDPDALAQQLETNGLLLAVSYWAATAACIPLIALFVLIRKRWSFRDYVALVPVSWGRLAVWLVVAGAFAGVADLITWQLDRDVVHEFMIDLYLSSLFPPLLWSALILAAPLFEEIAFRGFMFRGIEASRLGPAGAIVITAFLWAIIHVQYSPYYMAHIFLGGILFGLARLWTGSTWTTIAMHALWNTIATLETWWVVRTM